MSDDEDVAPAEDSAMPYEEEAPEESQEPEQTASEESPGNQDNSGHTEEHQVEDMQVDDATPTEDGLSGDAVGSSTSDEPAEHVSRDEGREINANTETDAGAVQDMDTEGDAFAETKQDPVSEEELAAEHPDSSFKSAHNDQLEAEQSARDTMNTAGENKETVSKEQEPVVEKKAEIPYSIRGRQPPKDGSEIEAARGGYRDTGSDAGFHDGGSDFGGREPLRENAPGTSFLESLTEEERRLRTRYLPDVEGIRMLHKSEIKRDLSMARSIGDVGTMASFSKRKGKKSHSRSSDEDRMDTGDEGHGEIEDDRSSEISSRIGSTNIDLDAKDLSILSGAFVAPPESVASSNGELSDTRESQSSVKRWQAPSRSSLVVESITAYNPPRPAESTAAKKKHRMLRWERNPQAAENELRALEQTVQNIRGELHRAENERGRLETVNSIMRTHFLSQLNAMKNEGIRLNDELANIQVDCVKAADLLTSRTRSRGAGKGVYVMRDVLAVLKSRGASLHEKGCLPLKSQVDNSLPGIGGLSSPSFVDWDARTSLTPNPLAAGWILPGDTVQTPYGEGVAIRVFGPSRLDTNEAPVEHPRLKSEDPPNQEALAPAPESAVDSKPDSAPSAVGSGNSPTKSHGFGLGEATAKDTTEAATTVDPKEGQTNGSPVGEKETASLKTVDAKGSEKKKETKKSSPKGSKKKTKTPAAEPAADGEEVLTQVLLPRVCVRLPFGLGFFPLDAVMSKEDPSSYSDAMLSSRWQRMVDVASSVGSCLDVAGTEHEVERERSSGRLSTENDSDEASAAAGSRNSESEHMEVVRESSSAPSNATSDREGSDNRRGSQSADGPSATEMMGENMTARSSLVPVGCGMLPTASSRGALLSSSSIPTLENGLSSAFDGFSDMLGKPDNSGVPDGVKNWEHQRYETYVLQAKVLQLRNELYRQRRIRTLNERTFVTSRDRSHRVENLLSEMRADLKSLKERLESELFTLGIDEEKAENILSAYFKDKEHLALTSTDATPPPKRKRKLPKEQPVLEPKHTRRRAAESAEEAGLFDQGDGASGAMDHYGESDDRLSGDMSGDDAGVDHSSDDDMDSRRATKRSRVAA